MDADTEWYLDERPHKQMHSMDEVLSGEREVHYTEDGSGWYEYYGLNDKEIYSLSLNNSPATPMLSLG